MMIKNFVGCFLLTTLMGLSPISAGQQAAPPTKPSAAYLDKQLNSEPPRVRATPPAQPNAEYLKERLVFKLPLVWSVQSVGIEASHNTGSASAPVYKQRFEAQISLKEDLYEPVEEDLYDSVAPLDKTRIVRTVAKVGDHRMLRGEATAVYLHGQYNVFFEFENLPADIGRRLQDFDGEVLVQGSPEEHQYTAERQRQRHADHEAHEEEEALAHEKDAEAARKKAVEEARKRAAADEKARKGAE